MIVGWLFGLVLVNVLCWVKVDVLIVYIIQWLLLVVCMLFVEVGVFGIQFCVVIVVGVDDGGVGVYVENLGGDVVEQLGEVGRLLGFVDIVGE